MTDLSDVSTRDLVAELATRPDVVPYTVGYTYRYRVGVKAFAGLGEDRVGEDRGPAVILAVKIRPEDLREIGFWM